MSRRNETRAEKVERMRSLIFEAETSGLSLAEFARQHDLSPQSIYWWRKRLRREDEAAPHQLIPVDLCDSSSVMAPATTRLEIAIGDALELRQPLHMDIAVIAELVSALRAC